MTGLGQCLQEAGSECGKLVMYKIPADLLCLPWSVAGTDRGIMVVLTLTLLVGAVAVISVGSLLWVVCRHFWTEHIPEGITHPVRLRILSCLLHLSMTWVSLCFPCIFCLKLGHIRSWMLQYYTQFKESWLSRCFHDYSRISKTMDL